MLTNVIPPLAFVMWTLTAKTLWDRIAVLARPVFLGMDIPAKVRRNFIRKSAVLIKQCDCKVLFLWALFDYYFTRTEIVSRQQFILCLNLKVRCKCSGIFALFSIRFSSILSQSVSAPLKPSRVNYNSSPINQRAGQSFRSFFFLSQTKHNHFT